MSMNHLNLFLPILLVLKELVHISLRDMVKSLHSNDSYRKACMLEKNSVPSLATLSYKNTETHIQHVRNVGYKIFLINSEKFLNFDYLFASLVLRKFIQWRIGLILSIRINKKS